MSNISWEQFRFWACIEWGMEFWVHYLNHPCILTILHSLYKLWTTAILPICSFVFAAISNHLFFNIIGLIQKQVNVIYIHILEAAYATYLHTNVYIYDASGIGFQKFNLVM